MNDARYRPFDVINGEVYRDNLTQVVRRFAGAGTRVVIGSPGCSGKIASWVQEKSGTLDEHNLHLAALRDIGIEVAHFERSGFADIFWPMYQAQALSKELFPNEADPYAIAGKDGIHPGWAVKRSWLLRSSTRWDSTERWRNSNLISMLRKPTQATDMSSNESKMASTICKPSLPLLLPRPDRSRRFHSLGDDLGSRFNSDSIDSCSVSQRQPPQSTVSHGVIRAKNFPVMNSAKGI